MATPLKQAQTWCPGSSRSIPLSRKHANVALATTLRVCFSMFRASVGNSIHIPDGRVKPPLARCLYGREACPVQGKKGPAPLGTGPVATFLHVLPPEPLLDRPRVLPRRLPPSGPIPAYPRPRQLRRQALALRRVAETGDDSSGRQVDENVAPPAPDWTASRAPVDPEGWRNHAREGRGASVLQDHPERATVPRQRHRGSRQGTGLQVGIGSRR